jgi:hypothetical protein
MPSFIFDTFITTGSRSVKIRYERAITVSYVRDDEDPLNE